MVEVSKNGLATVILDDAFPGPVAHHRTTQQNPQHSAGRCALCPIRHKPVPLSLPSAQACPIEPSPLMAASAFGAPTRASAMYSRRAHHVLWSQYPATQHGASDDLLFTHVLSPRSSNAVAGGTIPIFRALTGRAEAGQDLPTGNGIAFHEPLKHADGHTDAPATRGRAGHLAAFCYGAMGQVARQYCSFRIEGRAIRQTQ